MLLLYVYFEKCWQLSFTTFVFSLLSGQYLYSLIIQTCFVEWTVSLHSQCTFILMCIGGYCKVGHIWSLWKHKSKLLSSSNNGWVSRPQTLSLAIQLSDQHRFGFFVSLVKHFFITIHRSGIYCGCFVLWFDGMF